MSTATEALILDTPDKGRAKRSRARMSETVCADSLARPTPLSSLSKEKTVVREVH